jgi:hypothetical protein
LTRREIRSPRRGGSFSAFSSSGHEFSIDAVSFRGAIGREEVVLSFLRDRGEKIKKNALSRMAFSEKETAAWRRKSRPERRNVGLRRLHRPRRLDDWRDLAGLRSFSRRWRETSRCGCRRPILWGNEPSLSHKSNFEDPYFRRIDA